MITNSTNVLQNNYFHCEKIIFIKNLLDSSQLDNITLTIIINSRI